MKQSYSLHEVVSSEDKKLFLKFPSLLYRRDKNYVRPLDEEVERVFDKVKNKKLRQGDIIRWLLKNEQQKVVGRIAAFYDPHTANNNAQPTGGCGFFDCTNEQEAANILFEASKNWLIQHGMEAMDGSINFGDRDSFWGVLVDGFEPPLYNMPYNYPYYKDLFENYGFQNYFNQLTFKRPISSEGIKEVIREKAQRINSNPDYSFRMISWKNIDKFADDFMIIYNNAWGAIPGVKKITQVHARALLNKMKPILDPRLVHFGYYKDEPIAFFIMMQDLNQIIWRFNGNMNWFNKLRFMYYLKVRKSCNRVIGRIFGIVPDHQGKGIDGALIEAFEKVASKPGFPYNDLEMNWIGDFNPAMIKVVENIGGMLHKTHITYRYLFDRTKPFERAKKQ
jgi:GNAT superfamily N-acetyltransferase